MNPYETAELKDRFIRNYLPALLVLIVNVGFMIWWGGRLTQELEDHIDDGDIHMPMTEKIETFVLLDRYRDDIREVKEYLIRLDQKMDVRNASATD